MYVHTAKQPDSQTASQVATRTDIHATCVTLDMYVGITGEDSFVLFQAHIVLQTGGSTQRLAFVESPGDSGIGLG